MGRSVAASRARCDCAYGRPEQVATTEGGDTMPARTEKQRRFMGAELERKREGKKTQTGMSESELEKMASKPDHKKKSDD
jgi:hypothetical protein